MDPRARPYRSVLYIPGSKPRALDKARSLPVDAIIFDLEDAVSAGSVQALVPQQIIAGLVGDVSRQMHSWVETPTVGSKRVEPPSLGAGMKNQEGEP